MNLEERIRIQEVVDVINFLELKGKKCTLIYLGQNFYLSIVTDNFFKPDLNPERQFAGTLLGLPVLIEHRLRDSFYVESSESTKV